MKLGDVKNVSIKSLIGPGNVRERQQTDDVISLAASLKALGGAPLHPLCVVAGKKGLEIVAGRNRYAALLLNGSKTARVQEVLDANPVELLWVEIHENLERRHDDKNALTKALIDKAEGVVIKSRGRVSGQMSQNSEGRPKSSRQEAREIVADASGEDVATVKKRDQRAQAREEGAASGQRQSDSIAEGGARSSDASPLPPIETYGHELPGHVALNLQVPLATFKKIDRLLIEAQKACADFGMTNFSPVVAARIKEALHDAAARVRHEMPTHLCPKCHGRSLPTTGPFCGLCQEAGAVTKSQFEAAPKQSKQGEQHGEESEQGSDAGHGDKGRSGAGESGGRGHSRSEVGEAAVAGGGGEAGADADHRVRGERGLLPVPHHPGGGVAQGTGVLSKPKKKLTVTHNVREMTLEELEREAGGGT